MKIISFNNRGLASNPKKLSLKMFLSLQQPDIILLQETMGIEEEISLHLKNSFTFYDFHAISVQGNSEELVLGWNPRETNLLNIWSFDLGIGAKSFHAGLNISFTLVNIIFLTMRG